MLKDITDQTFGRLTVIRRAENSKAGTARWHCVCTCGGSSISSGPGLRRGTAKSCGCLQKEASRKTAHIAQAAARKHGHAGRETPEYSTWASMKYRCKNANAPQFADYGGRGIRVCERWMSFENFLADMGERPVGGSLDRIDNDGDYEPSNCRWATHVQQQNNKRTNTLIDFRGAQMTVADAIRAANLPTPKRTIQTRLYRGWSVEEAFS